MELLPFQRLIIISLEIEYAANRSAVDTTAMFQTRAKGAEVDV
jgi:hypothetical protein